MWTSPTSAAKLIEGLFKNSRDINGGVRRPCENDAELVGFIRQSKRGINAARLDQDQGSDQDIAA